MVGARPRFRVSGPALGGLLGTGLREPAWHSFAARLVGRLSRPSPSTRPPPPLSVFRSASFKGKARQSTAKAKQGNGGAGVGWGYDGSPSVSGE